jgi:hypothetical protein
MMAATNLWRIKGKVKDLIDYVKSPKKTVPKDMQDFFNAISYVKNLKNKGGSICLVYQLSERNLFAADDIKQKAVW